MCASHQGNHGAAGVWSPPGSDLPAQHKQRLKEKPHQNPPWRGKSEGADLTGGECSETAVFTLHYAMFMCLQILGTLKLNSQRHFLEGKHFCGALKKKTCSAAHIPLSNWINGLGDVTKSHLADTRTLTFSWQIVYFQLHEGFLTIWRLVVKPLIKLTVCLENANTSTDKRGFLKNFYINGTSFNNVSCRQLRNKTTSNESLKRKYSLHQIPFYKFCHPSGRTTGLCQWSQFFLFYVMFVQRCCREIVN